jgi:PCFT/HCP family folate transporter-like MFS transporter 1/3
MIPVYIFGFFYAIFYLKEVKIPQKSLENAAYDNQAMAIEATENLKIQEKSKNPILEFFDPQHAIKCITSLIKKRDHNLRRILILLMLMHMLCNGISQGEAQNNFLYVRSKLSWDADTFVYFNVFNAIAGLIGTGFAVGVLSKLFKLKDIFLVLFSTFLSIVSFGVLTVASNTFEFFAGAAIDFSLSVKFLAVRSIISKVVPADDLSTMFAVMGLFEALAGFVFPYIYPTFYEFLLSSPGHDISEIFMLSGILMVVVFSVYL